MKLIGNKFAAILAAVTAFAIGYVAAYFWFN